MDGGRFFRGGSAAFTHTLASTNNSASRLAGSEGACDVASTSTGSVEVERFPREWRTQLRASCQR